MVTTLRTKLAFSLSLVVVLALLLAPVAFAENVKNDVVVGGNDTFTAGGSTTINYWIQDTGAPGSCEASDGSSVTINIIVPAGVTATPSSLTFNACNTSSEGSPNNTKSVQFTSSTAGDYNITATASDSGDPTAYNTSPAAFTLHVNAAPPPSDTTPPSISYVLNPASPDGSNGWNVSDVTLTWTVTENESPGSLVKSGCVDQNITADQAETTYSCSATSDGGSAGPVEVKIKRDGTAPTISGSASPAANGNGWNNTDVAVSFTCNDATSGVASCGPDQALTSEGAGQTADGTAVDNAGNSATTTVGPINIDKTAPTASASASPAANANGWNNTDVTVSFSGTDGGSGVDFCDAPVVLSSEGAGQSASGTCTDEAGNVSNPATATVNIDKTAPSVSLVGGPADGASYYYGSVPAAPTCSASDALSGLDGSCSVSGYSAAVGSHTVTASATDQAGNSASTSATYTVLAWTLNGFYQPVDMNGVYNTVKGGSTVPLKFEVFAGPTELTATSVVKSFVQTRITCDGTALTDDIEVTTTGGTSLRYDTTAGQFIQNWQTPRQVGACYRVTMTTQDDSTLVAFFKLK